jgi:hypothetical protein
MATRPQHAQMIPATYGNRVRDRIKTGKIINKLQGHVDGTEEMTQTQIQAARILLDRTVPILKAREVSMGDDANIKTITNADLFRAIEGTCERK